MVVDNMISSSMETEEEKLEELSPLVIDINSKFSAVTDKRSDDEDRWLQAYHNYRGRYYKNIHFTQHEKSRVFVKITKTLLIFFVLAMLILLIGTNTVFVILMVAGAHQHD